MGKARTLAGLLAGGGVVRGGGKAQAPLSAPIGRASSPPQAHPTSPREPAGACKSRPVCREPAGPPRPSRLHCTRALHPNGCAISTPSYRCPRQSPPQAAATPLPHRLVRSSSRAVDRTNPGITVLLHKSSCTYHSAICVSTYHSALSTRPRGPGLEPHECPPPLQICAAHGVKAWELARAKSRDLGTDNYRQEEIGPQGAARTRGLHFCCIINLNTNTTPLSVEIVSYAPNPCLIAPLPRRSATSPQHICYPASVAIPRPCRPVP